MVSIEVVVPPGCRKGTFAEHAEFGVDENVGCIDRGRKLTEAELGGVKRGYGEMDRGVEARA